MNKISKHLLILIRRFKHRQELNKLSKIKNDTLQNILSAYKATKAITYDNEDIRSFSDCERYRQKLLSDNTQITYEIFSLDRKNSVKEICEKATSPQKWCQFLYYMVKNIHDPRILEIGTNVGISGSYILEAIKEKEGGKLTTMEGLPQLCEISKQRFSEIVPNSKFEIIQGLYENTFQRLMESAENYNLMFIDGNHKKTPTLQYFNSLKSNIGKIGVFVFDDIYWSRGMTEAWEIIKKNNEVNFSIDLYKQGIIIIDKDEPRKNMEFSLHLAY